MRLEWRTGLEDSTGPSSRAATGLRVEFEIDLPHMTGAFWASRTVQVSA